MCTLTRVARRARASLAAQTANNDTRGEFAPKPSSVYADRNARAELGQDFRDREMKFLDKFSLVHACAGDSEHNQNFPDSTEFSMYARFAKLAPKPRFSAASHAPNFDVQRLAR